MQQLELSEEYDSIEMVVDNGVSCLDWKNKFYKNMMILQDFKKMF